MRLRVIRVYAEDGTVWTFMFLVEPPEELPEGIYFEFGNPAASELPA